MLALGVQLAASGSTKKSSGSSELFFIVVIGLFALAYFLIIRPRQQRQRGEREKLRQASVGDEIATIGGLVGTIVAEDGDRVTVSTGSGTELVFLRQAIGRRLAPPEPPAGDDVVDAKEFEGNPGFDGPTTPDATASGTTPAADPASGDADAK